MSQAPVLKKEVSKPKPRLIDRQAVLRALAEHNKAIGFIPVPGATAQHARALMLEQGVKPENNIFSREIIAMRDEENVKDG